MSDKFFNEIEDLFPTGNQNKSLDNGQNKIDCNLNDESWSWPNLEKLYSNCYDLTSSDQYDLSIFSDSTNKNGEDFQGIGNIPKNNLFNYNDNDIFFESDLINFQNKEITSFPVGQNLFDDTEAILIKSKKRKSQNTPEVDLLKKKSSFYNVNFKNCLIYKGFDNISIQFIKSLGKDYNNDFHAEIKSRKLPKFERVHYRNKGVGIWFFETILVKNYQIFLPWLIQKQNFKI